MEENSTGSSVNEDDSGDSICREKNLSHETPSRADGNISKYPQLLPANHTGDAASFSPSNDRLPKVIRGYSRLRSGHRRLACSGCRQAKIKCDLSSASGRCKRCARRNEDCRMDAHFKRVNKRNTIAQLQEQIERLRSAARIPQNEILPQLGSDQLLTDSRSQEYEEDISLSQPPPVIPSPQPGPSGMSTWAEQSRSDEPEILSPLASAKYSFLDGSHVSLLETGDRASLARKLGEVSINGEEVNQLFRIFFVHYHPFLSILDPSLSPNNYYDRSDLLFWAIVGVASRHYEADRTLNTSLAAPVMSLLWTNISSLPHVLELIQAIILLSTWPFPVSTMNTDPSFTIMSVAKTAALSLGLHRPESARDFLRVNAHLSPKEVQEAVKTWAGCYIAAQSVTTAIGQQPLFTVDWAIDRACQAENVYKLPQDFRHRLLIQQFSNYVSQVMSENRQNSTGLPDENQIGTTLAFLERSYEDLLRQFNGNLTTINDIMLCCASLQLRSFYFFERPNHRQRGLLKSYATAVALINMTENAMHKSGFMIYSPTHFGHMLLTAGTIVLKILHSSFSSYVDFTSGKRAFNSAVTLLRRSSIEDNDLPGRSSKILAQLWSICESAPSRSELGREPSLQLKTRFNASVMHDALWIWRERSDRKSNSHPRGPDLPPLTNADVSEACNDVLPPRSSNVETQVLLEVPGLDFDLEDMEAIWDINMPPLLPVDLDL